MRCERTHSQSLAWLRVTLLVLPALTLLASYSGASESCPKGGKPGEFSSVGIDLCFQDIDRSHRHLEIASPDHSLILIVDGQKATIKHEHTLWDSFAVSRDEEIVWSPDSRALLFTISFGSAGPVSADFSAIPQRQFRDTPSVTEQVRRDFASRHKGDECYRRVNVAGLSWLDDSKKALFIAEVPPSPQCDQSGGHFEGYVVSYPGTRIVAHYSMTDTIARWRKFFGKRLEGDIDLVRGEHASVNGRAAE